MTLLKRLLWALPTFALIAFFLYSRKNEESYNIEEKPKSVVISQNIEEKPKNVVVSQNIDNCSLEKNSNKCLNICKPCKENCLPYDQGYDICEGDMPQAYNATGRIDICKGVDLFITASFIYWQALGDQLDLGIIRLGTLEPEEYQIIRLKTDFKPGFKVGLGYNLNHDNWDLYTQYTRYHGSNSTSFDPNESSNQDTFQTIYFLAGFNGYIFENINGNIVGKWVTDLDKIDLELARSYYVGTNLIFRPFFGASFHLMDEKYDFNFTYQNIPFFASFSTDSWASGPRFGLKAKWLFCKGFSFFGYGIYNLLFCSNKTTGSGSENEGSGTTPPTVSILNYKLNKDKQNILRDVVEVAVGFAWGSYFCEKAFHFDCEISYEAQKYSHTNYMSRAAQEKTVVSNASIATNQVKPGDTFLHGLTLTFRFDF